MKKFFVLFAFIPFLVSAQVDLSKYHNMNKIWEKVDFNLALKSNIAAPAFTGAVTLSGTQSMGSFGDASQTVLSQSSVNTNPLLGIYPMVNFTATAGKVFAGAYSRMLVITSHQTADVSIFGMESQFRLKGVNLANGVHAGIWAYAEQSGTSTLSGGGTFNAVAAAVESASTFTVGATEQVAGINVNSVINSGATINASANFSGVFIQSSGKDWFDGIYITGATNDIKLQNGAKIANSHADTVFITETALSVHGKLHVTGAITADGNCCADYAISDYQPPLLEYWAKTQELNRLPSFENKDRRDIMQYIGGLEEANERLLRYVVELEARISKLE